MLNSLAREDSQNEEVLLAAGLAALHIPQLPKTLAQAGDAVRLSLIRQVGEAQALAAGKRQVEAVQKYQSLIESYPTTSQLHYALGALLSDLGELEKAETEFQAELRITPGSVLARIGLAYVGLQQDSLAEALSWAREAVRLGPRSFMAHYLLGRLLVKANQLSEGRASSKSAGISTPTAAASASPCRRPIGGCIATGRPGASSKLSIGSASWKITLHNTGSCRPRCMKLKSPPLTKNKINHGSESILRD